MDRTSLTVHVGEAVTQFVIIAFPPLLAALAAGLAVGILQAVTQIQDQSLPQTVKLLVVVGVLTLFGTVLSAPLLEQTKRIFTEFPFLTRRG